MRNIPLSISFSLALLAMLLLPHLSYFAPFLALVYYATPLSKALWISVGCGVVLDLYSSASRMGIHTLAFVLTTLLLYRQKKHFFEDKPLAFSLFSSLISFAMTMLTWSLSHLFDEFVIALSIPSFFVNGIVLPLLSGIYAFLWFTCPLRLYTYTKKVGWRNILRKRTDEE